ncbi:MAG: TIGR03905 family TSCPD domain-containing protein [Clostridia bacterium]|nr:TIGR03905 family TSCPD domain-containing protein [Clostridia bacterium]MDE6471655.1 TIGR03905 family TSCPD domain-containing protein [Clostridia bacterium]
MHYTYNTSGTCSKVIDFDVENGVITNVKFTGGCNGNLKGIGKLVEGMKVEEVAEKLKGIQCGPRSTSCPDQLARACEAYISNK